MADVTLPPVQMTDYDVTCNVEGCMNDGETIRIAAPVDNPMFFCGPCTNQITDFVRVGD